jgi:hypothetical protein
MFPCIWQERASDLIYTGTSEYFNHIAITVKYIQTYTYKGLLIIHL